MPSPEISERREAKHIAELRYWHSLGRFALIPQDSNLWMLYRAVCADCGAEVFVRCTMPGGPSGDDGNGAYYGAATERYCTNSEQGRMLNRTLFGEECEVPK